MKYPELYTQFNQISPLPEAEWGKFEEILAPRQFKKGDHLLEIGEQASEMTIILQGGVRFYYITEKGDEFNRAFKFEGEIASAYSSLLTDRPSFMAIQALEDTTALTYNWQAFQALSDGNPFWERLGRKVAEQHYIGKERREFEFLTMDTEGRYKAMLEQHPGITERVPQFHLASYLGVTAPALNRIIKSLQN